MSTDPFAPAGPGSALALAVAILVPSANERLEGRRRTKLRRTSAYMSKFDIDAHRKELETCWRIGLDYRDSINRHEDTTNLTEFFGQFAEIQRLSHRLSKLLMGLRGDARFLLDTVFDDDEQLFEKISDGRSAVKGLPDPSTRAPGELAKNLTALANYLKIYTPVLEERLGGKERKFRTNSPTVGKLTTPSPIWALIGDSWKLFGHHPHLKPSGSADGDLREFVHAIHVWVTGDTTRNFAKTVKKYASYKSKQAILLRQLPSARTEKHRRKGAARETTPAPSGIHDKDAIERRLAELEHRLHFEFFPTERRK
jgi:hypothetical protein